MLNPRLSTLPADLETVVSAAFGEWQAVNVEHPAGG